MSLLASLSGAWVLVAAQCRGVSQMSVLWGAAAGIGAAIGATALYRGYGLGQMAVAGPLSAVGTAALPAIVGAALGERLPAWGVVGIVLAMPALPG